MAISVPLGTIARKGCETMKDVVDAVRSGRTRSEWFCRLCTSGPLHPDVQLPPYS